MNLVGKLLLAPGLCLAGLGLATVAQAGTPTPFAPPAAGALVVYRHATVVDTTGASGAMLRPDMDVVTDGERIVRVIPDRDLDPSLAARATVVDLTGRFLMPGLVDSHVHLETPPNRRQAEAMLRRDLYGGVTAVRDMADDLRALGDTTRASRVGEIPGPDIYYAALMAGPDFFTDPRTHQTTAGAVAGQAPWMRAVTPQTDLRQVVAEARGTSATALKLYADLTPPMAERITAEAHRQHLLVWAHATLFPARPSQVVAAGVDAISHACLVAREAQATVPRWAEPHGDPPLDAVRDGSNPALAKLFAEMKRRGVILDATIWVYGPDTAGSTTLPALPPGGCDDVVGGAVTGQAWRAGVAVSAGTDNVGPWDDPWPDLFHELDEMSTKAGMPNAAILTSATLIGARAAGQDHDMGSLETGKLANMVVLARDPLADLANLKSVVRVIKRGRVFERAGFVPLTEGDITDR